MSDISAILTSGTVSLTANTDYSGLTLTLDNATIKTENSTFSNSGTLAVVLVGNNVLSSESSSAVILSNSGILTIGGTGKLTLSGSSAGIQNNENSSIALNGGTLEMNGTSFGFYGSDNSSLTLNSGTLDMKGGSSGYYGTSSSALTVNDGVLMAKGGSASIRIMKDGQMTLASGVAITQPYGAKWDNSGASTWDVTDATGHTITSQVTIAKGAVAAELAYSASTGTATCGETPSLPTLTNPYSLPITYSSSNTTVATVGNDGKVTVLSPGTTTITASFDGSATYLAASVSYTLTVNEAITEVEMSFTSSTPLTAIVGTEFTEPTLSTTPKVTVTYSSSNPLVATVNETTGKVTPLTSGSTTITASYAGNGTLSPKSAFYTLTVNAKEFNASIGSVILTTDHIKVPGRLTDDLGSNLTGGTVSLTCETDYSSPKLTLNGATITNTGTSSLSVSSGGTLALVLEGDNQITSTVVPLQNHGTLNISGTGKLTLSGAAHGIENDGSITLNEGTLDVTGTQLGYYGNTVSSNLTISDGVLMATGGTASIRAKGSMVLGEGVAITQPLGAQKGTGEIWDVVDASGHTITSKVTIAKGAVAAGLDYSATEGTATYGVAPTSLPTLTNTHSLPITYSSSNTAVATINSEGAVTILHPGTTTITASFDGSATYLAASASYTLTVNKGTPVLTFSATEATATYGTTPNVLSLTVQPEELLSSINYISTIEDKATVGTDKKIQIKKKGLTYIKAIFAGNEYYKAAEAQYALTINPATATLQFGNDEVNCKVGETISSQTAQTSPGELTVTYSSSLPDVAGVDETTGKVTASQAGTATITGTVNTDQYYGTKSYQVTITKNANDLAFEKTEVSAAYGDVFTPPTLINPHELGVNYSSSDHSVALVDPISGVVTFKTTGEVDITADFVGNGKYEAGNATYHLTITKKNAALAFAQPTATATYSAAFTELALTNPNHLTVTYESSEPTVATVATDGKVTVLKTGETTISAKFTGNTLYNASTVSYVLTVNPKIVSSPTITLSATSFTYDGTAKQPSVTVKDGSTTIPASEYTIGYSNNTNVGTATVTITDNAGGNYTVSGSTTFAIAAADGSLTPPVGKTGLVFSGTAQNLITAGSSTTGTVQYSLDGTTYGTAIPQGTDAKEYTIYYKVVAKAGYKDVAPASFKVAIAAKSVSSPTITLSATSFTYDGTAKQPTVTVKDGSTTIPASEYTVGYSNNTNVGTATVTITDKAGGNYTVSGTTTFAIAAADGSLTPPVGKTGLIFSGTAQNLITAGSSTTGTVQYSLDGTTYGTAIPQGTDAKEYTIYYKVVAKAGYKDVAPASFKVAIAAKSVSSPTITLSATSFTYDGTAKQPTVTVKDGSTTIPASEYTVGYSNNTNVGTATVTITDKAGGNYTVSGTTTFVIVLRGDANGDNKVDVSDIVEMVNAKAGRASAKFKMANADIDNNGSITETDINAVTRIIMGE